MEKIVNKTNYHEYLLEEVNIKMIRVEDDLTKEFYWCCGYKGTFGGLVNEGDLNDETQKGLEIIYKHK